MTSNRLIRVVYSILFISLALLGIVEGVHTIWIMVQLCWHPNDPSSVFKGRLHALVVASIWTTLLCPLFTIALHKSMAVANSINTTIFLGLTWILWLVGAVLITQYLGDGIDCTKTEYCHQLYHALGFGWGAWLITTLTCVMFSVCGIRAFSKEEDIRRSLGTKA